MVHDDSAISNKARQCHSYDYPGWPIRCVAISPNERYVAIGSFDCRMFELLKEHGISPRPAPKKDVPGAKETEAAIVILDSLTGEAIRSLIVTNGWGKNQDLVFSPDGNRLAYVDDGVNAYGDFSYTPAITVFDFETGKALRTMHGPRSLKGPLLFSPDGHIIVATSQGKNFGEWTFIAFNADSGEEADAFPRTELLGWPVCFHPSEGILVSAAKAGELRFWDIKTGQKLAALSEATDVSTAAFSPDGAWLAVGANSGKLGLWRMDRVLTTGIEKTAP